MNNDLNVSLFVTGNHMASEDVKHSTQVEWTTIMEFLYILGASQH